MFERTDHPAAPWHVVPSDNKKAARLNCLSHILACIPHAPVSAKIQNLPSRISKPQLLKTSGTEMKRRVPLIY